MSYGPERRGLTQNRFVRGACVATLAVGGFATLPAIEMFGSLFGGKKGEDVALAASAKPNSVSYSADRCGGEALTAGTLYNHWESKGILDDVIGYYNIPTVDESVYTYIKNHFGHAILARDADVQNTGCDVGSNIPQSRGRIIPVGVKHMKAGQTEWAYTDALKAEFPEGYSLRHRPGYTRVVREVREGASDESSNPRKGRIEIFVWVPPAEKEKEKPKPNKPEVNVLNFCEDVNGAKLGRDGICPSSDPRRKIGFQLRYKLGKGEPWRTTWYNANPERVRGMRIGNCTLKDVVTVIEYAPVNWAFWASEKPKVDKKTKRQYVIKSQTCDRDGVDIAFKKFQKRQPTAQPVRHAQIEFEKEAFLTQDGNTNQIALAGDEGFAFTVDLNDKRVGGFNNMATNRRNDLRDFSADKKGFVKGDEVEVCEILNPDGTAVSSKPNFNGFKPKEQCDDVTVSEEDVLRGATLVLKIVNGKVVIRPTTTTPPPTTTTGKGESVPTNTAPVVTQPPPTTTQPKSTSTPTNTAPVVTQPPPTTPPTETRPKP